MAAASPWASFSLGEAGSRMARRVLASFNLGETGSRMGPRVLSSGGLSVRWINRDSLCRDSCKQTLDVCPQRSAMHHRHYHHHSRPSWNPVGTVCCGEVNRRNHLSLNLSETRFNFLQCSRLYVCRRFSTSQEDSPAVSSTTTDPYELMSSEMGALSENIRKQLCTDESKLRLMSHYYFDGKGKSFRPLVALLMSKACNIHRSLGDSILESQRTLAMVAEMIHTASLVHDDVIDSSDTRRGQSSLNRLYGQRQSILVGDFILAQASVILAQTGSIQAIALISSVIEDLVSGEFMQLGSKENENERFSHYLKKTFKKTASLIANSCKAVVVLAEGDEDIQEAAFQFGRNLGIAFQLIDDLLDFVSSESVMGKPTAADLKLGLATAPVLFAAQEFPELHPMIMRRFSKEGDVEKAYNLVSKSNGVGQTRLLASKHSVEAIKNMQQFAVSDAQQALIRLATVLLERKH